MKNLQLYKPNIEDLSFRQDCMGDPKTMSYNAGYDVSYSGYHYDTGCIDFPKSQWENWFNSKLSNPNFFYAYIKDLDINKFVGYCNFNLDPTTGKATMGIVIKDDYRGKGYMKPALQLLVNEAKNMHVQVLTDTVPETRENALKSFYSVGFTKTGEYVGKKFNKDEVVAEIELSLS